MTKLTQEEIDKMYAALPKQMYDFILSDDFIAKIHKIAEKNEFDEEEFFTLIDFVNLFAIGARDKTQFKEMLTNELFCAPEEVSSIMNDVEKEILSVGSNVSATKTIVNTIPSITQSGIGKWRAAMMNATNETAKK